MKKLISYLVALCIVVAAIACVALVFDFEVVLRWAPLLFSCGVPLVLLFLVGIEATPAVKAWLNDVGDRGGPQYWAAFVRRRRSFLSAAMLMIGLGVANLVVVLRVLPAVASVYRSATIPVPWLTQWLIDCTELLRTVPVATVTVYLVWSTGIIYWVLRGDRTAARTP